MLPFSPRRTHANKEISQSLSPDEQRLFRLYGKLPNKKDLLQNKLKVKSTLWGLPQNTLPDPNTKLCAGTQVLRLRRLRPVQSRQSLRHRRHPDRPRTPGPREHPPQLPHLLLATQQPEWQHLRFARHDPLTEYRGESDAGRESREGGELSAEGDQCGGY